MRIAAARSWRFLVVIAALAVLYYGLGDVSEITVPVTIALLLCAAEPGETVPGRPRMAARPGLDCGRRRWPALGRRDHHPGCSTVRRRVPDLAARVTTGLDTVQNWLVTGPFKVSQDQIDSVVTSIKQSVLDNREAVASGAVTTATSAGRVVTGLVLVMFILFFFLRVGKKIWHWIVGLAPARLDHRPTAPPTGPGGH
jgi:predicted PurR-regulated permease PerM